MDLKALIAKSRAASQPETSQSKLPDSVPTPLETPQPVISTPADTVCICSHPEDAHDDGAECGILECECVSFSAAVLPARIEDAIKRERQRSVAQKLEGVENEASSINQVTEQISKSSSDAAEVGDENSCHHICQPSTNKGPQGCGLWWSHGAKNKCRHPDMVNLGLCPTCLGAGKAPLDPLEDFDGEKLTPAGVMRAQNKARNDCKDMNVEQLTFHIQFLMKQIEMLKAEAMGTKKMRTEQEEELLLTIPPGDREKFIQALRQGKSKAKGTKKAKEPTPVSEGIRLSKYERHVKNLMATMGKTRAQVEAFLND